MNIDLKPVEMTQSLMESLERDGLIIRLAPRNHEMKVPSGKSEGLAVYHSDPQYGGHMLLAVTCDDPGLHRFGFHPDNEEFLFIGPTDCETIYLAIYKGMIDDLNARIAAGTVNADQFVCLTIKYNDPYLSYFTVKANVPHGECARKPSANPPSFYVLEPSGLPTNIVDFKSFHLRVAAE